MPSFRVCGMRAPCLFLMTVPLGAPGMQSLIDLMKLTACCLRSAAAAAAARGSGGDGAPGAGRVPTEPDDPSTV